jgi:hypothetical protein
LRCSRHGAVDQRCLPAQGLFYLGGLARRAKRFVCFAPMCLWPQHFALWAYGFALMCAMTIVTRLIAGWRAFGDLGSPQR